jgi:uncharacterized membrane protein
MMPFFMIHAASTLVCFLSLALLPRWTRRGIYFGISVDPQFRQLAVGRTIYRRYLIQTAGFALLSLILGALHPLAGMAGIFLQTIGALLSFAGARRQVAPHSVAPDLSREATLGAPPPTKSFAGLLGAASLLPPAVAAWVIQSRWASIPDPMPIHFGIDGQADRWAPKSIEPFLMLLFVLLAINVGIGLSAVFIQKSRHIQAVGQAAQSELARRSKLIQMLVVSLLFANTTLALVAVAMAKLVSIGSVLGVILAATLALVFYSFWFANQLAADRADQEAPTDSLSDEHWRLGIFYANADDPAVMVEQRTGVGYTLNFARPQAWLVLAVFLAPLALHFLR